MKIMRVGAGYLLRLSNGNYGSEESNVSFVASLEDDDDQADVAAELQLLAKQLVEHQLSHSSFDQVRAALDVAVEDASGDSPF